MILKAGHTAGPCRPGEVRFAGRYQLVLDESSSGYVCEVAAPLLDGEFDEAAREARVLIIAESFNVAHETGLTPRQLANDLRATKSVLAATREHVCRLEVERDEQQKLRVDMIDALRGAVAAWDKWFQSLPHAAEDEEFREMQAARAAIAKAKATAGGA